MKKVMLACIGALLLCSACLSARDLECWYDDMCKDFAGPMSPPAEASSPLTLSFSAQDFGR